MIQGVTAEWSFPSLSATESCKSQDLQDFFYFVLLKDPPFVYHYIKCKLS